MRRKRIFSFSLLLLLLIGCSPSGDYDVITGCIHFTDFSEEYPDAYIFNIYNIEKRVQRICDVSLEIEIEDSDNKSLVIFKSSDGTNKQILVDKKKHDLQKYISKMRYPAKDIKRDLNRVLSENQE